jgi:hypothetical protein
MKKLFWTIPLFLSLTLPLFSAKTGWEPNTILVRTNAFKPSLCCNKNNVFMAYVKKFPDNTEIFFMSSTNEGRSWGPEIQITRLPGSSEDPRVLFVNNRVYIVWTDFADGNDEIYFTFSKDPLGAEFEKPQRVTFDPADSIQPILVTTGFKLILIWSDDRGGDYELYSKVYDPLVNKWDEDTAITKFSGGSFYPYAITVVDEIHLVWQKKEGEFWKVMYSRSGNGKTWEKPVDISLGLESAYEPTSVYSAEGLKVIFQGQKNNELNLYMNTYDEMSSHWLIPMVVTKDINIERSPRLLSTTSGLYAFWYDYSEGNNEIFASCSTNEGLTWSAKANVSDTPESSRNYNIAYNSLNDNIYAAWEEGETGTVDFTSKDRSCPQPVIVQSSHSSNEWSYNKDATFSWSLDKDSSGIKDYAYLIDEQPETKPDLFIAPYPVNEAKFYALKDGIWYFHLRARDNMDNMSETTHYRIKINSRLYSEKVVYYIIKYGDTLWDLCQKFYNNPRLFTKLADYNQINRPEWIYPHQIVKIPPLETFQK